MAGTIFMASKYHILQRRIIPRSQVLKYIDRNEYSIKTKPDFPKNQQANIIIARIHQVLGNLVSTYSLQEIYVDDADLCMVILASAAFAVRSTYHRTNGKITG